MELSERERFEALFHRCYPRAARLAERIVGPADAEDVAVEAFARALVRWPKVHDLPHVDAWVLRTTTNAAIDVLRRRRRQLAALERSDALAPAAGDELTALRLSVRAALTRLPRRQAEVIGLRYLAGLPEPEVASTLGISLGAVKTHARRGMHALRRDGSLLDPERTSLV